MNISAIVHSNGMLSGDTHLYQFTADRVQVLGIGDRRLSPCATILRRTEQKSLAAQMIENLIGDGHLCLTERLKYFFVGFAHFRFNVIE